MKNILIVCALPRDYRELSFDQVKSGYQVLFSKIDDRSSEKIMCNDTGELADKFDPSVVTDKMCLQCEDERIDGLFSSGDYPGSIFASIVAQQMGLRGPNSEQVMLFQHKYYARLAQLKYVPEATPNFMLIDPCHFNVDLFDINFPVFIKPVKSFFSVAANQADDMDELHKLIQTSCLPTEFSNQFKWFARKYSPYDFATHYLLAEDLLQGIQATLEGFVFEGQVEIVGVVDSIMFPNKISFKQFNYPSCLSQSVQERMGAIATRLMQGVGFDNSFFNIEFMYNPDTDALHIIEVNPRMISQFADLIEKVDGTNTYELALALSVGDKPKKRSAKGSHTMSRCFVLRTFENKKVIKAPGTGQTDELFTTFPDARLQLFLQKGQLLSEAFQDGKSYRYGLVHLGGRDEQELQEKFDACKQLLGFQFEPIEIG